MSFSRPLGVMFLARQHMAEIKLHRAEVGHAHLEIFFDHVHMIARVLFGPADDNGVIPDIFLVAHLDHFFGDAERNAAVARMRRAAGSKNQFTDFARMIECEQLRHPPAHGVAANDGAVEAQMIQYRRGILGEHVCAIFR